MTILSVTGVTSGLLLTVVLLQWLYLQRARRQMGGLSTRLRLAEAENSQLRRSIGDLIASRQSLIEALTPRRIDDAQRKLLADHLSLAPRPLSVEIRVAADPEAEDFAAQLQFALTAAGVNVLMHRVIGIGPTSLKGADTLRLLRRERAALIHDALSAAGIALRMIEWPEPPAQTGPSSDNTQMPDAVIMLNRKPVPSYVL
jgi:hypothetical protein